MRSDTVMQHQASSGRARRIRLTMGQFAIVDAEDYDWLSQHKWCASVRRDRCYAQRNEHGKSIKMHREILHVPAGLLCDHRNHNGLDNRKCNLRICTPSQNSQNRRPQQGGTSRYKGVWLERTIGKWRAVICHRGRTIHIGYYDYEVDAAIAYDDKAIELFGEFAYLNFQCRPEIEEWLRQTYFFPPTKNDLVDFVQTHPSPDAVPIMTTCDFQKSPIPLVFMEIMEYNNVYPMKIAGEYDDDEMCEFNELKSHKGGDFPANRGIRLNGKKMAKLLDNYYIGVDNDRQSEMGNCRTIASDTSGGSSRRR